jgi:hypothetical protein
MSTDRPDWSPRQPLLALARANHVRLTRATLKRRLRAGEVAAADAILRSSRETDTMTIAELLMSQRGWGPARSAKMLRSVSLSEKKDAWVADPTPASDARNGAQQPAEQAAHDPAKLKAPRSHKLRLQSTGLAEAPDAGCAVNQFRAIVGACRSRSRSVQVGMRDRDGGCEGELRREVLRSDEAEAKSALQTGGWLRRVTALGASNDGGRDGGGEAQPAVWAAEVGHGWGQGGFFTASRRARRSTGAASRRRRPS